MDINISFDSYLELEKIGLGVFKPLLGFMTQEEFISVVDSMRLKNGKLFPIPVMLPITEQEKELININNRINLIYEGSKVGNIQAKDIFKPNFQNIKKKLFGTDDLNHPGYQMLINSGKYFLGGPIIMTKKIKYEYSNYSLSPVEVKKKIKKMNLKSVAGFQTRNVPHRAHEYILTSTLKEVDGLFINPLIGKKKKGDFLPSAVLKSYDLLIKKYLPKNRVLLGALTTSMRYAGPREAVFHALIRRNYGCTHFLVGRDHAGVSDYYGEYDAQDLCVKLEDEIGIKIIKVRGPFYCKICKKISNDSICKKPEKIEVSGTKIRKALMSSKSIDNKFMRAEIIKLIKKSDIFIK